MSVQSYLQLENSATFRKGEGKKLYTLLYKYVQVHFYTSEKHILHTHFHTAVDAVKKGGRRKVKSGEGAYTYRQSSH